MTDATDTHIATVAKNATEDVRISLTEFNGKPLADLRIYTTYRSTGQYGPTKKGLTVSVGMLPDLIGALQEAYAEALRQGLVGEAAR